VKPSPLSSRPPSNLPASVHQRLNAYALAAGAAGVSLLALAPTAEAKIVYTPANIVIGRDGSYSLDLNHDGIVDFIIAEHGSQIGSIESIQGLVVLGGIGNQVNCPSAYCISGATNAASLTLGEQIGPNQRQRGWLGREVPMAFEQLLKDGGVGYGYFWINVSNRYLGFRFKINGENHYGWARVTTKFLNGDVKHRTWEAHLTGYAYETVADKAIRAGQTEGDDGDTDASFRPNPANPNQFAALGRLALGADGIALWRREEADVERVKTA
jgi:hypothetical protein